MVEDRIVKHIPIVVRICCKFHSLSTPGWLYIYIYIYVYIYKIHIHIYICNTYKCALRYLFARVLTEFGQLDPFFWLIPFGQFCRGIPLVWWLGQSLPLFRISEYYDLLWSIIGILEYWIYYFMIGILDLLWHYCISLWSIQFGALLWR